MSVRDPTFYKTILCSRSAGVFCRYGLLERHDSFGHVVTPRVIN